MLSISSIFDDFDHLFWLQNIAMQTSAKLEDNQVVITAVAPGRKKEDFSVDVFNNVVKISVGDELLKSYDVGKHKLDLNNSSASYEAGILTVKLPFMAQEKKEAFSITVS